MSKPKLLVAITSLSQIDSGVDGYIVGYNKFTSFASIYLKDDELFSLKHKEKFYILLNALIHEKDLGEFKKCIDNLTIYDFNFIVQDIGALSYLLTKVDKEKVIFNPYTLVANKMDLKTYYETFGVCIGLSNFLNLNDYYDLGIISPTYNLIYGHYPIYQTYRNIITLYNEKYKRIERNISYLQEKMREDKFPIIENTYGTTIFSSDVINHINNLHYFSTSKYLVVNLMFLNNEDYIDIINNIKERISDEKD